MSACAIFLFVIGSSSFLHYAAASSASSAFATASQITSDGLAKTGVFSDGSNLYVAESTAGHQVISKIVPGTGEHSVVATPFGEIRALDVSPDHASLLASPVKAGQRSQELWSIPLGMTAPRRIGEIAVDDAAWSPDGEKLVFVRNSDVYIASRQGTDAAKLATLNAVSYTHLTLPTIYSV